MQILTRTCNLEELAPLREQYRTEMNCQIIHDSIHVRQGWSVEYLLEIDGVPAGYGSVAIAGPWKETPVLYEFFVADRHRQHIFALFTALRTECRVTKIETQSNDHILTTMLHTFASNIQTGAILFEDSFTTQLAPAGAAFRTRDEADVPDLKAHDLDDGAGWVVTSNGRIAGAGGVLYHYNRPYGDVYMKIAGPFRQQGLGAYLVQELKRACREAGSVPAARCNVTNGPSRKTLQKAGFVPCGNLITGELK